MYQIKCDQYILYDPRDDELLVLQPKCNLEVNKTGGASFTILKSHPFYDKLQKLKSIFEIKQDGEVIFRGRMTGDSIDFNNQLSVDLEGVLGFANDSIIDPFNFPNDFPDAEQSENVVEYFFQWILGRHNAQVESWKQLKPGVVTVSDPNNYITRSSSEYNTTWNVLKTKLLDMLGGYIVIRYEDDGNYLDYVDSFELTNTQPVTFGENLLNLVSKSDASATYSAILPIGKDGLTIEDLEDGDLTDDLVKQGKFIYSKSARENFGWICVPPSDATWTDVTIASNLQTKAMDRLAGTAMLFSGTIELKALDLGFTNEQIQSFRIYRNVLANSPVHGLVNRSFPLMKLGLELLNPQNTTITIGNTVRTLTDVNDQKESDATQRIENTKNELKEYVSSVETDLNRKIEGIDGTYFYIRYSQYADGHVMVDVPTDSTKYMGTCSTNESTAPTDPTKYTWVLVKGSDGTSGAPGQQGPKGEDGVSTYFHVKYSNDGLTFTANNGETLGDWMGTCVTNTEADPTSFSAYTWKKIKGEPGSQGIQGIQGPKGEDGVPGTNGHNGQDGQTSYFHIKYSAYSNPTTSSQMSETPNTYIGTYVDFEETDSTDPSKYTWSQFKGSQGTKGDQGIAGTNGTNGQTSYLHIAYANNSTGTSGFSVSDSTNKSYIGQYTDFIQADSTDPTKYRWTKIKGEDGAQGLQGLQGEKGDQGIPGQAGATSYFHIKYSSVANPTTSSQMTETPSTYIGTYVDFTQSDSTDPTKYTWSRFSGIQGEKGDQGIPGTNGQNGQTSYLHIAYANNATGTSGFSVSDSAGKLYIGQYTDFTSADSTDPSKYHWTKIKGDDGINGVDGKDGISTFFFVKFSANANGNPMTEEPQANTKYMGVCSTTSETAPTDYTQYTWTQCRGNDGTNGTPGPAGADGKTQYLHIKYSDDGQTFTANNGEELGAYIGTLVDFVEADSTNFNDYTWKKFTEDVDEELDEIRQVIDERYTTVSNDSNTILMEALKSYTETSVFEKYQETVSTRFEQDAEQIQISFNNTTDHINEVDGDAQRKFAEIYKYITFVDGSITLGSGDSAITLVIENDMISFKKNGLQFGWWDGVDFHTGNIVVEVNEKAQFGNFAFVPRSDGSLMFLKVGG